MKKGLLRPKKPQTRKKSSLCSPFLLNILSYKLQLMKLNLQKTIGLRFLIIF